MEEVKPKRSFFTADSRTDAQGLTLDRLYRIADGFALHERVPDEVRSHFNGAVTLWLYGYLYYPFFTLAHFQSHVSVELALRTRLQATRADGLKRLLTRAVDAGLLRDDGFPSLPHQNGLAEELREAIAKASGIAYQPDPPIPVTRRLAEEMPRVRNLHAHPTFQAILMPQDAAHSMRIAAELIRQLWPEPAVIG